MNNKKIMMQIIFKLLLRKYKKLINLFHFSNFKLYIIVQKNKKIKTLEEIKVLIYLVSI